MINTLSLFLSPDERNRSSHARKNLQYIADLYLQGLLIQEVQDMETRLETAILESSIPTTVVDMTKLTVKQTPLFLEYVELRREYFKWVESRLDNDLAEYVSQSDIGTHTPMWRFVLFPKTLACIREI